MNHKMSTNFVLFLLIVLVKEITFTVSFLTPSYVNSRKNPSPSSEMKRRSNPVAFFDRNPRIWSVNGLAGADSIKDGDSSKYPMISMPSAADSMTSEVESTLLKLRELRNELESVRKEHGAVNNNTDELGPSAQYGGNTQFALAALKKRKLALKDRIAYLEGLLNKRRKMAQEVLVNPNNVNPNRTHSSPKSIQAPVSTNISKHRSELPAEWLDIDTRNMVGNGAYGEVYEARVVGGPLKGLRVVAKRAKVKRAKEADGSSAQRYLEVEAYINDVLMALCPEIAPRYLGICNKKGREWLVWEFAGTETLEDILLRCAAEDSLKPLAIALRIEDFDGGVNSVQNLATEVAVQLLTCCKALEESGIAHRDVKPNNLLVRDGRLCLIDLGSAAAMGFTSRTGFDENKACWTTAYAPPELFIDVARWAVYDVYSVALILLRMVFPPLWDGGDFESFSGAYQAAGYDLDAWLRQIIAREKLAEGSSALGPKDGLGGNGAAGAASGERESATAAYLVLAEESCSVGGRSGPGLRLCALKPGLQVLDMTGEGVCWDLLQAMLAKDPVQRITPTVALSLLLDARRHSSLTAAPTESAAEGASARASA